MDNLTHSLVGALIGQMGLKRKTGLAMPTLIIAANIPDIDAVAVLLGGHQHLAIRRGITHGPIAMVVLPLLLWGTMLWFDTWQARRGKRPDNRLPIHKGWLLALAFIGCLSHPLFDWFNSYGVRLLKPFSSQWFYGDTLFIIDTWIWAALIAGLWLSLRRERRGQHGWAKPAVGAGVFLACYVALNFGISSYFVGKLASEQHPFKPKNIIANPVPVTFWKREMLWQSDVGSPTTVTRRTEYSLVRNNEFSEVDELPEESIDPAIIAASALMDQPIAELQPKLRKRSQDLDAFLFWSRMPIARYEPSDRTCQKNCGTFAVFRDARFFNPLVADRFTVRVKLVGTEGYLDRWFVGKEKQ
jgi:inner membrane protein